jgi:hypothetical protein
MGKLFACSLVLAMVSTFGAAVARETVALRTNRVEIAYMNCGDWVESCSALVEHEDGRFEILTWFETGAAHPRSGPRLAAQDEEETEIAAELFLRSLRAKRTNPALQREYDPLAGRVLDVRHI